MFCFLLLGDIQLVCESFENYMIANALAFCRFNMGLVATQLWKHKAGRRSHWHGDLLTSTEAGFECVCAILEQKYIGV